MKKFHKDRLLKLANFLRELPRKAFDLSVLAKIPTESEDACPVNSTKQKALSCGTVACAMGWCPTIFPRQIAWEISEFADWENDNNTIDASIVLKDNPENKDFQAAIEFFGLNNVEEAYYLFHPWEYPEGHRNAKYVAKRIESYVNSEGANARRHLAKKLTNRFA